MTRFLIKALVTLRKYFNVLHEKDDEKVIYEEVRAGVDFHGANAWVLVFAIFTASLGLNVNSTAVIIGAMLISPLMGPIVGIGFSLGVNDLNLLKVSYRNLGMATLISVLTATLYFWISPLDEAQSELLARTSPTIYDVFIALCGGAAGVVALFTRGKGGNVIPGVAIATALMPPLCTAGYGLAMGNFSYFFGAFYLFFINTVFICLSTFVGVRLMKFNYAQSIGDKQTKQIRGIVLAVVLLTMVPATFFTVNIVRDSYRDTKVRKFVHTELDFPGTHILSTKTNTNDHLLNIIAVGREITAGQHRLAEDKLAAYGLDQWKLNIIQGSQSDSLLAQKENASLASPDANHVRITEQAAQIQTLEAQVSPYNKSRSLTRDIAQELRSLYPQISRISLTPVDVARVDTSANDKEYVALISLRAKGVLKPSERASLTQWLRTRSKIDSLRVLVVE